MTSQMLTSLPQEQFTETVGVKTLAWPIMNTGMDAAIPMGWRKAPFR